MNSITIPDLKPIPVRGGSAGESGISISSRASSASPTRNYENYTPKTSTSRNNSVSPTRELQFNYTSQLKHDTVKALDASSRGYINSLKSSPFLQNDAPATRAISPTRGREVNDYRPESHHRKTPSLKNDSGFADLLHNSGVSENAEDVAGMHGRVRLQKTNSTADSAALSGKNWMDKQRKNLQAYEYLCHVGEAKEWIEACIGQEIAPVIKLEESLRNGIVLAKLTKRFAPNLVKRIFEDPKLQFRHSENINYFFNFLEKVGMPDLFTFELTDLYDKKNIPKVIYCVHALSFILYAENVAPAIGDLVGKLEFTEDEIKNTQRGLDAVGLNLPNFKGMNNHFKSDIDNDQSITERDKVARPVETEEEIMVRELEVIEPQIVQLQAVCKGHLTRLMLYNDKYILDKCIGHTIQLQSMIRGNFVRKKIMNLHHRALSSVDKLLLLQSLIRAKTVRTQQTNLVETFPLSRLIELQSQIRAKVVRRQTTRVRETVSTKDTSALFIFFQSVIRGNAFRQQWISSQKQLQEFENSHLVLFQSRIRGNQARGRHQYIQNNLTSTSNITALTQLQSLTRGKATRKAFKTLQRNLNDCLESILGFQTAVRCKPARNAYLDTLSDLDVHEAQVIELQSILRGNSVRQRKINFIKTVEKGLLLSSDQKGNLLSFQALIRGNSLRHFLYLHLNELRQQTASLTDLQSIVRGYLTRMAIAEERISLVQHLIPIVRLQSHIRGVLARFGKDLLAEEMVDEERYMVEFQSHIRGYLVRKPYNDRMQYYIDNMDKIIKIQSFVRAKRQGDAYKSLTSGSNPPLSVIKKFIHLLNDNEADHEEEIQLEIQRKKFVDEVHNNEMLEQFIQQLDVKIALLVKNKITLDELIKHRNRGMIRSKTSIGGRGAMDLKSLNKTSRQRLELYQGLLYILQTQPVYFARLFKRLRESVIPDKEMRDIEELIMTIYGHRQRPREDFFLLQLISRSIREEISDDNDNNKDSNASERLRSFTRINFIWYRLLAAINRGGKERRFLKGLLGPVVNAIADQENLNLESDPLAIYRKSINAEELRTGVLSDRNPDLPVNEAIQDPETRSTFIGNLQRLRDYTNEFLNDIESNLEHLPYHIRLITREAYRALKARLPSDFDDDKILRVVGHIFFTNYLYPAIVSPDNFGIVDGILGPLQRQNLGEIAKMLVQLGSLRTFSRENVYLQPLNEYIKSHVPQIRKMLKRLIDVADPENYFNMNVFDDLTATSKPILYIKPSEIFLVHSLVVEQLSNVAPEDGDALRDVLRELGPLPSNASEVLNVAKFTEIKLNLNPSYCRVEDPETEVNSLFADAKRLLVYVIRVQTGADLLQLLLAPVRDEHELKYQAILREETQAKEENEMTCTMNSPTPRSYRDLKLLVLEKVIDLEACNKITRRDSYQEIVNSIAVDIRTKRDRREARHKETANLALTMRQLTEKEAYLQTQLKNYNSYIEQAMVTLQSKKGKRKSLVLPFTKQYFHLKGLQRAGKVPKFGSYKYSATRLIDKGVLAQLTGYTEKQYDKVAFTFSSDEVGIFNVEAAYGSIALPGACINLTLDELLSLQFNNQQYVTLFDGMVQLNTNLTLHLIFKKFYSEG
ncbi:hypothetical protein NADFUDRAFT_28700 [Nadsonia fulvescens var. elongata DSM 6958]|uniref:Uncharacterized protein n=1 Tax=Nadsonia fulvescens var. elongata DSM 6958 TaxID=857566 RepID=A0A1E3PEP2_9ASCO|nr:hypothetical protein NADFUDRAFT_28700 [Nadsonia fulvescens var. elongata DSM 6958]